MIAENRALRSNLFEITKSIEEKRFEADNVKWFVDAIGVL